MGLAMAASYAVILWCLSVSPQKRWRIAGSINLDQLNKYSQNR